MGLGSKAVIASGARTASGRFLGGLSSFKATDLGAVVIKEAVKRANLQPSDVQEVIMGNVVQAGLGQNPARQSAMAAGIPDVVNAFTINKVCGSGLKSVMLAAQAIKAGEYDVAVAGGMERMSNVPYYLERARTGYKLGHGKLVDGMVHDGLWCAFGDCHMGVNAEYTAEKSSISREEQDQFAYESHQKAVAAIEGGKFKEEIVPVEVPQRKGDPVVVAVDETPRKDTTVDVLAKLRPVFQKGGSVTAGNAPGTNDGAAALVVCSEEYAKEKSLAPLGTILGYTAAHVEPKELFYAPVKAVKELLDKLNLTLDDIDLIEANEAFSVQSLADGKELGWDWSKVNVHGGAVALGHPIGASGARVLVTLLYAMKDRGAKRGISVLCLGGGGAVALAVER
jgi:acetyl-CoA C-acetyltransferase